MATGSRIDARTCVIAALALALVWFGATIVRLENIRYANEIGMCDEQQPSVSYNRCIDEVETRVHPIFHLYYGLFPQQ